MFTRNGYTESFFSKIVNNFLDKKFNQSKYHRVTSSAEEEQTIEKRYILIIPFIGRASNVLKRKLSELVKKRFDKKLCCVFNSCKVKDYFSLKCGSHPFLNANVVYKFSCQSDSDKFYLGETGRHIGIRAGEHLDISKDNPTAIGKHIIECEACFNSLEQNSLSYKDFEIVKSGKSKFDVQIKEALLIKRLNPTMNKQLYKSGSEFTLRIFN